MGTIIMKCMICGKEYGSKSDNLDTNETNYSHGFCSEDCMNFSEVQGFSVKDDKATPVRVFRSGKWLYSDGNLVNRFIKINRSRTEALVMELTEYGYNGIVSTVSNAIGEIWNISKTYSEINNCLIIKD